MDRAPVIERGNVAVERDIGDVRAVVAAYAALLNPALEPATLNTGTGRLWSIREVLSMLTRLTGHAIDPSSLHAGDPARLGGYIGCLRARLPDWRPIALEDTLRWILKTAQV